MKMNKAYRYRIYPTKEQEVLLNKTFGCVRVIWNRNVAVFNSYDKENNPNPIYKSSTKIRSEFEWMSEVSASALQQKEIDFRFFKNHYFSKLKKVKIGKCSFKHKNSKQSYRLPNQKFILGDNNIRLEKIGLVCAIIDRKPSKDCKFISVTVSKDRCNKFFASIIVEEKLKTIFPSTGKSMGIDLGLKEFAISSDGDKIGNPRFFRESQAKLRKAQKNLSRKKIGSNRFYKCKLKVARIHSKITNQRKWFHHQVSIDMVKNYDFIALENLNIKGMVKNRRLAKSISDAAWSQFVSFLEYKASWHGKKVVKINRFFPSSKTCSKCGWKKDDLLLSDREFACDKCGNIIDRDANASINILKEAQGVACA